MVRSEGLLLIFLREKEWIPEGVLDWWPKNGYDGLEAKESLLNTCCPNCSSNSAVGCEIANACADCASVSVAGASFNAPLLFGAMGLVVLGVFAFRALRNRLPLRSRLALG